MGMNYNDLINSKRDDLCEALKGLVEIRNPIDPPRNQKKEVLDG